MANGSNNSINYRPDIDGLRAIAVIAVVIFHFFPSFLKGGFGGVDVFFVISGYLVTSIIYKGIANNSFSFSSFYIKRVKRLFPSLILVLISCLIFGYYFLVASEFTQLGKHTFSGALFIQNIILFFESGYFDGSSDLKPLLHLWSLCIEEQFYFIWPVTILSLYKLGPLKFRNSILTIFIISLLMSVTLTRSYQSFSFFLLPTRLWELALGGVLIFIEKKLPRYSTKPYLSYLGLIIIIASFFILTPGRNFPGYQALLPTLGTVLVIISSPSAPINKFLSKKAIVYIGLISYPLYLWHWPVVSFTYLLFPETIPESYKVLLVTASFLLAIITYELLEKPIKKLANSISVAVTICGILFAVAIWGGYIFLQNGLPNRFPHIEKIHESKKAFVDSIKTQQADECRKQFIDVEICLISDPNIPPTVLLIGDSHANHLYPGLKKYYDKRGENILLLARSGTSPLYNTVSKRTPETNLDDVFDFFLKNPTIQTIILNAFWSNYYELKGAYLANGKRYKNVIYNRTNSELQSQEQIFEAGLDTTFQMLLKSNKKVIFIYDIPIPTKDPLSCVSRPHLEKNDLCSYTKKDILNQNGYRIVVDKLVKKYAINIFDPWNYMCNESVCKLVTDSKVLYSDYHHLSITGSLELLLNFDIK